MVRRKAFHQPNGASRKRDALCQVPCLGALDAALLTHLQDTAREKQYGRGEILVQQGAVCEEIFVVIGGSLKIYRLSQDGRQQTLQILGAGDCFCLAPSFHKARYPGTVQCLTDVTALRLGPVHCLPLPATDAGFARRVIACLCRREASMAGLLEVMSARQVRRRLARFLVELAHSRGVPTSDGILLDGGLTHDELADCVGTSREVISRDLERLQREGLVRLGRGRLTLPSPSRLEALSLPARRRKVLVL